MYTFFLNENLQKKKRFDLKVLGEKVLGTLGCGTQINNIFFEIGVSNKLKRTTN